MGNLIAEVRSKRTDTCSQTPLDLREALKRLSPEDTVRCEQVLAAVAHAEYLRLGRSEPERHDAYCQLFKAHLDPERITAIRTATNGNYALGNERFKDEIGRMLKQRVIPGKGGRPAQQGEQ